MASPGNDVPERLRLITYLSPGIPMSFFDCIMHYLEEALQCEAYIICESRWSGPPLERKDPFTRDEVDIAFMCSSAFLSMMNNKNPHIELCGVGAIHQHPKADNKPVYFADIVIHSAISSKVKEFHDLKGRSWAYNDDISLSGNLRALAELKKMGFNSSFFGNYLQSGSHLKSLEMILERKVDAASIDSNTLQTYLRQHPEHKDKLSVLVSLGPLPIYPVVFNKRLPDSVKEKITAALLEMNKIPKWQHILEEHYVNGYVPTDMSLYDLEVELQGLVKGLKMTNAYY